MGSRRSCWFRGDRSRSFDRAEADWWSGGGILGKDHHIYGANNDRVGTAVGGYFSGGVTNGEYDRFGSDIETRDYSLGIYGSKLKPLPGIDNAFCQLGGSRWGGYSRAYDVTRVIRAGDFASRSEADTNIWDGGFWINNSALFRFGEKSNFFVAPQLGFQYQWIGRDDYHFRGAGDLNLDTGDLDQHSAILNYGARFGALCEKGWGSVKAFAHATAQHEFLRDGDDASKRFDATFIDAFETRVDEADRDWVMLGLGVSMKLNRFSRLSLDMEYDAAVGFSDFEGHRLRIGVGWSF